MEVFNHSAQYYDLLYSTKKYDVEVAYVDQLIKKYNPITKTILDLGCGTGSHGFFLAENGYDVTGIDLSDQMISIANSKKEEEGISNITFRQGNILTVDLGKTFDTVVSLFHVMNYLISNSDMQTGFANATKHVKEGGIFIFDCWYGPAVLTDLPKVGVKRLENDRIKVTRIVEPVIHPNTNVVDVNYEILVEETATASAATIKETHSVRYFFKNEIEVIATALNMEIIAAEEWVTAKALGFDTFGVCFVMRKSY